MDKLFFLIFFSVSLLFFAVIDALNKCRIPYHLLNSFLALSFFYAGLNFVKYEPTVFFYSFFSIFFISVFLFIRKFWGDADAILAICIAVAYPLLAFESLAYTFIIYGIFRILNPINQNKKKKCYPFIHWIFFGFLCVLVRLAVSSIIYHI